MKASILAGPALLPMSQCHLANHQNDSRTRTSFSADSLRIFTSRPPPRFGHIPSHIAYCLSKLISPYDTFGYLHNSFRTAHHFESGFKFIDILFQSAHFCFLFPSLDMPVLDSGASFAESPRSGDWHFHIFIHCTSQKHRIGS